MAQAQEQFVMEHGDEDSVLPELAEPIEIETKDNETVIDTEIEIVDDTPPADQGRQALPVEVRDTALEDDMEGHSTKVQERINQLKKAYHDMRRDNEAKDRLIEENTNATQYYMGRTQQLQQQQAQERQAYMNQASRRAELEMEQATSEYQEAFDEGDAEAVAKAQVRMNDAGRFQGELSQYTAQQQRAQPRPQQQAVAQPQQQQYTQKQQPQVALDPDTQDWVTKNKWFGPGGDHEMTATAMGLHEEMEVEGFRPGSPEYFKRIDARMRTRFPEKFGQQQQRPSTVVAPAGRTPQGRKVVLTETQVRLAKSLGLTPQQYANGVAKMNRGNS